MKLREVVKVSNAHTITFNKKENSMKSHILLDKAFVYPLPKCPPDMQGLFFDSKKGFWINGDGTPAVSIESFTGPRSKKCDIETGEDQKGE